MRSLARLNAVDMHVVRYIFGESRFAHVPHDDAEVRSSLGVPSIDCLVLCRRLLCLRRLTRAPLATVRTMLALRHKGAPLPWVQLSRRDLASLHECVPELTLTYPASCDVPQTCSALMRDPKRLHDVVYKLDAPD